MDVVMIVLPIVATSLVLVVLLGGILFLVISRVKKKAEAVIREEFDASQIIRSDPMANFFGVQSKGGAQIRGNGPLVLTKEKLWFRLLVPKKTVEIPFSSVTTVRTDKWFLHKTKGRPVLIVEYTTPDGPDAAGWIVRDTEGWVAELTKHISR